MPVNITDVDAFTDPVQAPTSGDSKTSYGFLRTAIQGVANRTRNLKNRIDPITGYKRVVACGSVPYLVTNSKLAYASSTYAALHANAILSFASLQVGDIVEFDASVSIYSAAVLNNGQVRFVTSENGAAYGAELPDPIAYGADIAGATQHKPLCTLQHTVAVAGNFGLKVQVKAADNTSPVDFILRTMRAIVIRAAA